MNTPLVSVARRILNVLEPHFGKEMSEDRAANLITGIACDPSATFSTKELEENVRGSIGFFRQAHCGGFNLTDEELDSLTKDTLTIIFEELPSVKS